MEVMKVRYESGGHPAPSLHPVTMVLWSHDLDGAGVFNVGTSATLSCMSSTAPSACAPLALFNGDRVSSGRQEVALQISQFTVTAVEKHPQQISTTRQ